MGQRPIGGRPMTATERSARKREADRMAAEAHNAAIMEQADTLLEAGRELDRLGAKDMAEKCRSAAQSAVMMLQNRPTPEPITVIAGVTATAGDLNGYDPRQAAYAAQSQARAQAALERDAQRKAKYG